MGYGIGRGSRPADLMQVAAAVVGTAAATQVIMPAPRCPVVRDACPGDDRGVICKQPCSPEPEACRGCGGLGTQECVVCEGDGTDPATGEDCTECDGNGEDTCEDCHGSGVAA